MRRKQCVWHSVWCVGLLCCIVLLESYTDMDMTIQRLFYDTTTWLVPPALHGALKPWVYVGPKVLIAVFGAICFVLCGGSFIRADCLRWRRPCMFLCLSLILIPLLISSGKQLSNIYTPAQLTAFGGTHAYQRILEPVRAENAGMSRGKGFPAGHASGGFALMALYFVGQSQYMRRFGLTVGLTVGWGMGLYQMFRGEHFLSHTLFSMVLAWLVLCVMAAIRDE